MTSVPEHRSGTVIEAKAREAMFVMKVQSRESELSTIILCSTVVRVQSCPVLYTHLYGVLILKSFRIFKDLGRGSLSWREPLVAPHAQAAKANSLTEQKHCSTCSAISSRSHSPTLLFCYFWVCRDSDSVAAPEAHSYVGRSVCLA